MKSTLLMNYSAPQLREVILSLIGKIKLNFSTKTSEPTLTNFETYVRTLVDDKIIERIANNEQELKIFYANRRSFSRELSDVNCIIDQIRKGICTHHSRRLLAALKIDTSCIYPYSLILSPEQSDLSRYNKTITAHNEAMTKSIAIKFLFNRIDMKETLSLGLDIIQQKDAEVMELINNLQKIEARHSIFLEKYKAFSRIKVERENTILKYNEEALKRLKSQISIAVNAFFDDYCKQINLLASRTSIEINSPANFKETAEQLKFIPEYQQLFITLNLFKAKLNLPDMVLFMQEAIIAKEELSIRLINDEGARMNRVVNYIHNDYKLTCEIAQFSYSLSTVTAQLSKLRALHKHYLACKEHSNSLEPSLYNKC